MPAAHQTKPEIDYTVHNTGWPHHISNGNCICECRVCFDPKRGCICKTCAGHNHANCRCAHPERTVNCSQFQMSLEGEDVIPEGAPPPEVPQPAGKSYCTLLSPEEAFSKDSAA